MPEENNRSIGETSPNPVTLLGTNFAPTGNFASSQYWD
jgi:hypothetical protein